MARPAVADVLIDIATNGTTEAIRVKASAEAMDRAGLRGGVEVDVSTTAASADPATVLRERFETVKRRTLPSGDDVGGG